MDICEIEIPELKKLYY